MLKYRKTEEFDRDEIAKDISVDPDHADKSEVGFWLGAKDDGSSCFVVSDEQGDVFSVRAETLMRLHIQFKQIERERTARAIDEFTVWIKQQAKHKKCEQLIFESVYKPLIRFLAKRGFRSSKDEQICDL